MLTRDTQATHDTVILKQLLKRTHDFPEIEKSLIEMCKVDFPIVEFPTAQLRNTNAITFLLSYIIKMCYLYGNIN